MASRNIGQVYDLIRFIVRQERGIFVTIPEVMNALDAAQLEKLEDDYKLYKVNQTISDSISPFKVANVQFTSDSVGGVTYPDDYMHFLDDIFTVTGSTVNKCTLMKEDEKANALTNQLRAISLSNPYYENTAPGFQLYPQSQQTGFYSYIRRPAMPNLVYTQVGRTITYDIGASQNLEWYDNYINNVIARALAYLSVYMDEDKIQAFAQMKQQQTSAG